MPSRTAMAAALMRAHQGRSEADPVLVDPLGDALVPQDVKDELVDCALAERSELRTLDRARVLDKVLRAIAAYPGLVPRSSARAQLLSRRLGFRRA